jgi:predicted enzyme related to lactoylglutathione lyase
MRAGPSDQEHVMPINPVRWFEIYVQDMSRAKRFYEAVFQVTLTKEDATVKDKNLDYWTFPALLRDQPGTTGALVKMPGVPSGGMGTMVYFACDDCAATAERAVKAGGKIKDKKMSIGQYGFIALVFDTEGNMIGLHSLK